MIISEPNYIHYLNSLLIFQWKINKNRKIPDIQTNKCFIFSSQAQKCRTRILRNMFFDIRVGGGEGYNARLAD